MKKILIFFGMTASGKSTLASEFAAKHQLPCYNTDAVRKTLVGLQSTDKRPDPVNQGIYSPALTAKTYLKMLSFAKSDLERGAVAVVLDGSYGRRADRDRAFLAAAEAGAEVFFVYCYCDAREVERRLSLREKDSAAVSDGRMEIYLHQLKTFELPAELPRDCLMQLETGESITSLLDILEKKRLIPKV